MAQCTALALATERIEFATAIAPIYAQTSRNSPTAPLIHEISGGRFQFGIGVAHGRAMCAWGDPRQALGDTRAFVEKLRSYESVGGLAPIVLATLRKRMIALAARSPTAWSLPMAAAPIWPRRSRYCRRPSVTTRSFLSATASAPAQRRSRRGARRFAPHDEPLRLPAVLPQLLEGSRLHRGDDGDRKRIAAGRNDEVRRYLTDRWLDDVTLGGPAAKVREGVEAGARPASGAVVVRCPPTAPVHRAAPGNGCFYVSVTAM